MHTFWVTWLQQRIWDKDYPPEMKFLFNVAPPRRHASKNDVIVWDYFPTPSFVQINIFDDQTALAFKLKFPDCKFENDTY